MGINPKARHAILQSQAYEIPAEALAGIPTTPQLGSQHDPHRSQLFDKRRDALTSRVSNLQSSVSKAKANKAKSSGEAFRFLDLPAELREYMYGYLTQDFIFLETGAVIGEALRYDTRILAPTPDGQRLALQRWDISVPPHGSIRRPGLFQSEKNAAMDRASVFERLRSRNILLFDDYSEMQSARFDSTADIRHLAATCKQLQLECDGRAVGSYLVYVDVKDLIRVSKTFGLEGLAAHINNWQHIRHLALGCGTSFRARVRGKSNAWEKRVFESLLQRGQRGDLYSIQLWLETDNPVMVNQRSELSSEWKEKKIEQVGFVVDYLNKIPGTNLHHEDVSRLEFQGQNGNWVVYEVIDLYFREPL